VCINLSLSVICEFAENYILFVELSCDIGTESKGVVRRVYSQQSLHLVARINEPHDWCPTQGHRTQVPAGQKRVFRIIGGSLVGRRH